MYVLTWEIISPAAWMLRLISNRDSFRVILSGRSNLIFKISSVNSHLSSSVKRLIEDRRDSGLLKWHPVALRKLGYSLTPQGLLKKFLGPNKAAEFCMAQPCRKATHLVLALVFWDKCSVPSNNDTKHILILPIAQILADLPNLWD